MFGAILKATNSSFQKGMTFYRSIYVTKVMKQRALIFEQPSHFFYMSNLLRKSTILNPICSAAEPWDRGKTSFIMLNSTEYEIYHAHKC